MSDSDDKLTARHSFYTTSQTPKQSVQMVCKSDVNLLAHPENYDHRFLNNQSQCCGEYYKKYDHDELPVKDHPSYTKANATGDSAAVASITNSQIDSIEKRVCEIMSGELQSDITKAKDTFDSISITSSHLEKLEKCANIQSNQFKEVKLQSNIEFFKTTVNQIFDTFYETMQDFDLYKKRFNEILNKNRVHDVNEMEEFIKDIIQHIMASELSGTNVSKTEEVLPTPCIKNYSNSSNIESNITASSASGKLSLNESIIEDYKNQNYYTDSTDDQQEMPKTKRNRGDIFNIYLLNSTPMLEIKMNERNLVSEVNIRNPHILRDSKVASAENLKKLAAKRNELEKYAQQYPDNRIPDIDIPVRVSSARKDIHVNDDLMSRKDDNKSFMSKICNYFCKKFRKNSIV